MKRLALVTALLPLAACATAVASPTEADQGEAERPVCRASGLEQFAGRPANADLGREIMRVSGARDLQWVAHGTMVTMDFREERVRVWLDEGNRVLRVNCG